VYETIEIEHRRGARGRWVVAVHGRSLKPLQARAVALAIEEARAHDGAEYAAVVAAFVSPRSAEILERHGVGFADLAGNCRLASESLFIERTGFPNAHAERAPLRSLFTPGAERVLRALLDPTGTSRSWTLRDLAAASSPGVSVGQAHRVSKLLEEQAFLRRGDGGLVVQDEAKLLAAWRRGYRFNRNRARRYYSPLSPGALLERFRSLGALSGERGYRGALASFTAAAVLAPIVRQHRFFAYWLGELVTVEAALELKLVDSGENVVVYEPYDDGVFYPSTDSEEPVTCPVQTYLDVAASPARGEEAAEAVREGYLTYGYVD